VKGIKLYKHVSLRMTMSKV